MDISTATTEYHEQMSNGISTHMILREKYFREDLALNKISETYYPQDNMFVVVYKMAQSSGNGIQTLKLHESIDEETKNMLLKDYRRMCENRQKIIDKYSSFDISDMYELERIQTAKFIERMWHWCNKESFIFPTEDANGVSLIPIAQAVNQDTITVTYYPMMDEEDVFSRLIDENERIRREVFARCNGI